jgi:FkbM family methyltransferase
MGSGAGGPGGRLRRVFGGGIRIPFRTFEAEFELSQGEIAPYAQMKRDLARRLLPNGPEICGWTVVDCGANVGLFSLFMKDAARLVAVEPNPAVVPRLRRNLESNEVVATVVEAAVSSEDGAVKMSFGDGPSVLSAIGESGSEVRAVSLDSLFEETHVDEVDLLKLDVEGHEIEALQGGSTHLERRRIKRIVVEFNDDDALAALDRHLAQYGFSRVATGEINARFDLGAEAAD